MTFNSVEYLCFLTASLCLYYVAPERVRIYCLTFFSLLFIALSSIPGLLMLLVAVLVNYLFTRLLYPTVGKKRKALFVSALCLNLVALFTYKYIEDQGVFFRHLYFDINPAWMTFGFSFYTLQHIALLADIYNRMLTPLKFSDHLFYTSFFPKIQSGPVELPGDAYKNMHSGKNFLPENIQGGIQRIFIGLFKKMVIADGLALSVSSVFENEQALNGITVLSGLYLFTIQLYFDFSGYTDIALGSAHLFGYKLPENFNRPFLSRSITEFWRRWHMSLIQWFTRYVYYPVSMGIRGYGKIAVAAGIITTFLFSGLWHGIGLTFMIWSAIHCTCLLFEYFSTSMRKGLVEKTSKIKNILCILIVFNLVCFSNLFFRAGSMESAMKLMDDLFNFSFCLPCNFYSGYFHIIAGGGDQVSIFNFSIILVLMIVFLFFEEKLNDLTKKNRLSYLILITLIILILLFGEIGGSGKFIYKQF